MKTTAKGNTQREWLAAVINMQQDDCIDWPFSLNRRGNGYGLLYVDGKRTLAHRHVCLSVRGLPPTTDAQAAHSCGRSTCVNPRHLRWATAAENAADKVNHGTDTRGDRHPGVRLTDADAMEVRRRRLAGAPVGELAREYGVSSTTISLVASGRRRHWLSATLVAALLFAACTPEQLATYQNLTGDRLSPEREATMLALEDHPMKMADGAVIELDGSVTPPTPCDVDLARINAQTYNYTDPAPAMDAFRVVARCRGWNQAQIDSWAVALEDIMRFESGFCPNILGGARIAQSDGCVVGRQGRRGDAGFGQLISLHYRPGAWLCNEEGLCSKWDVIATPQNSMTALLALVERSGTQGWCFNASARRLHNRTCSHPGLDV